MAVIIDKSDDEKRIIFFNILIAVMEEILEKWGDVDISIVEEIDFCVPVLEV